MKNVQKLQRDGENFPNAYVGHMAAETVISHNVITSGQLPKHMGWTNEVYRDTDAVLGTAGNYYITSSMSCAEFKSLIEHCLRDYEFTVIDTPPTNLCADARRISNVVGYGIVVAKRNVSFFGEVQSLAHQLEEDGARVIGTVLSEV